MNSIMEEVNKIVESKEDIRDKTSKILELDFSDSDIDDIAEAIINMYEDAYDEIYLSKEEIIEDIREISYRNAYLSMVKDDNNSKKEDALNQKDKFIKKILRLIRNKTKGLKENKGEPTTKQDEETIWVPESVAVEENSTTDETKDKTPSTIIYPEIIDDTKKDNTPNPLYDYNPVNGPINNNTSYNYVDPNPNYNYMGNYIDDSLSLTEQINRVKARMRAIEAEEIHRIELEYKKRTIINNYNKRKEEILANLEKEMQKELAQIDYEINSLKSQRAI